MKRRSNKAATRAKRSARKKASMAKGGRRSRYAKKKAWLHVNPHVDENDGKTRCFGFEVGDPKPWN